MGQAVTREQALERLAKIIEGLGAVGNMYYHRGPVGREIARLCYRIATDLGAVLTALPDDRWEQFRATLDTEHKRLTNCRMDDVPGGCSGDDCHLADSQSGIYAHEYWCSCGAIEWPCATRQSFDYIELGEDGYEAKWHSQSVTPGDDAITPESVTPSDDTSPCG